MRTPLQRGFSLVELMIAMAIALVILLAASVAFLSAGKTQRAQTDTTRLNESSRFAFDLIARELRKGGYRNTWQFGSTAADFCGVSGAPELLAVNDPVSVDPTTPTSAGDFSGETQKPVANASDALRVRYAGEDATATSPVLDCQGYAVAPNVLVEDTLYVRPDPNNKDEPSLYCVTTNPANPNAGSADVMPLVAGIESLQLLYGEDTDGDGSVNRYVPWGLLTARSGGDNVLALKISLVVRSPNAASSDASARTFRHFGTSYPATANADGGAVFETPAVGGVGDRRLRVLLSTEVALRNFSKCWM